MPQKDWSNKRQRQYEHIKEGAKKQGASTKRAQPAATVTVLQSLIGSPATHEYARRVGVETLDHVALWVEDRDSIADFAVAHLGMHVIERTERFTLVGSDARRGKLTLFAAEGS